MAVLSGADAMFNSLDTNGDGVITREELENFERARAATTSQAPMGPPLDATRIRHATGSVSSVPRTAPLLTQGPRAASTRYPSWQKAETVTSAGYSLPSTTPALKSKPATVVSPTSSLRRTSPPSRQVLHTSQKIHSVPTAVNVNQVLHSSPKGTTVPTAGSQDHVLPEGPQRVSYGQIRLRSAAGVHHETSAAHVAEATNGHFDERRIDAMLQQKMIELNAQNSQVFAEHRQAMESMAEVTSAEMKAEMQTFVSSLVENRLFSLVEELRASLSTELVRHVNTHLAENMHQSDTLGMSTATDMPQEGSNCGNASEVEQGIMRMIEDQRNVVKHLAKLEEEHNKLVQQHNQLQQEHVALSIKQNAAIVRLNQNDTSHRVLTDTIHTHIGEMERLQGAVATMQQEISSLHSRTTGLDRLHSESSTKHSKSENAHANAAAALDSLKDRVALIEEGNARAAQEASLLPRAAHARSHDDDDASEHSTARLHQTIAAELAAEATRRSTNDGELAQRIARNQAEVHQRINDLRSEVTTIVEAHVKRVGQVHSRDLWASQQKPAEKEASAKEGGGGGGGFLSYFGLGGSSEEQPEEVGVVEVLKPEAVPPPGKPEDKGWFSFSSSNASPEEDGLWKVSLGDGRMPGKDGPPGAERRQRSLGANAATRRPGDEEKQGGRGVLGCLPFLPSPAPEEDGLWKVGLSDGRVPGKGRGG